MQNPDSRVQHPISIHVPREGDDFGHHIRRHYKTISIHVPREGDDCYNFMRSLCNNNFNPRPP